MAQIEDEQGRRISKRMSAALLRQQRSSNEDTVQMLLADQAIKTAVPAEVKQGWSTSVGGANVLIAPTAQWVMHLATAIDDFSDDLFVLTKSDSKKREEESGNVGRALAMGRGVIAITAASEYLPKIFKTVTEATFKVEVTPALVGSVIKKVASGRLPRSFGDLNISALDFDELCGLIIPGTSAVEIHAKFKRAVAAKTSMARVGEKLPRMEEATEFGNARLFAMDLKKDLEDFKAGLIGIEAIDKGIVLHGPPGTGKTLWARSLGEYLGVPVILGSMADFFASGSGYLDSVVKAQRDLFERAKAQTPSLIFIDELDACPDLDRAGHNRDWWGPVVNDFLALLDGAGSSRDGVIVIGATNRPDALAPALLRPGRFERKVYMGPPDADGVLRILRHHLGADLAKSDLDDVVQRCVAKSMTGAILMEKVRSAKRLARRQNRPMILQDLKSSIFPKESRSDAELLRIAIHEAGHALIAGVYCPELLISVDIEPDDDGGGATRLRTLTAAGMTFTSMKAQIMVYLGGRAAEIVLLDEHSAGSGGGIDSDLHKATSLLAMSAVSLGLHATPRWRCEPNDAVACLMLDTTLQQTIEEDLAAAANTVEAELAQCIPTLQSIVDALLEERMLSAQRVLEIIASTRTMQGVPEIKH